MRERGLGTKRSLALREFALGIEALERFVRDEPLRRVHECVFCVLALESEPVDESCTACCACGGTPSVSRTSPEAQGEYAGYEGRIGRLLREGGGPAELAAFLGGAERRMGFAGNVELDELVASKVLDWYAGATREA